MNSYKFLKTVQGSLFVSNRFLLARNASNLARYNYETLSVTSPSKHVLHVELNRPNKRNALNQIAFREILDCFNTIAKDKQARVVVLSGKGKIFCAGLDFMDVNLSGASEPEEGEEGPVRDDIAGRAWNIREGLSTAQAAFTAIAKCSKPVIAAIHSGCIGAGMSMVTAADVRFASKDAFFSIREVNLGLACDLGALQRLPKITGNDSLVRQIAFNAKDLPAEEAKSLGIISEIHESPEVVVQKALEYAQEIAAKSPVAVQGTKILLNYSRDHSDEDGLAYTLAWNQHMLQSEDMQTAVTALITKDKDIVFPNL